MFSKNLKKLREAAQENQKDVAEAVFVSSSAISQYEHGHTTPSRNTLEALARHFNVSTDYLLGTSANPDLEELMNEKYCDDVTVSRLLEKCMHLSLDNRSHILAVINAFLATDSTNKPKGANK